MRTLTVVVVGLCALAIACGRPKRPLPEFANPAFVGYIDRPANGGTVGPEFLVAGWAMGKHGIARVRVYLDDELMETALMTAARPDLEAAYPQYAGTGPLHGFGVLIDAGTRAGYRTLRLEAVDRRGSATYVASANLKIDP
jgi:hypothetical protein